MNSPLQLGSQWTGVLKLTPSRQVRDDEQAVRRLTAATGLAAVRCLRAFNKGRHRFISGRQGH